MIGFSASPSSAVGKAGGAVLVGVNSTVGTGLTVLVDGAGERSIRGKLQFARTRAAIGTNEIIDIKVLRFTSCVEIIIPA